MRTWLIDAREERGYSQQKIAAAVKISQPSYCNIENGKRRPSPRVAKRIAAVLGFDRTRFYED